MFTRLYEFFRISAIKFSIGAYVFEIFAKTHHFVVEASAVGVGTLKNGKKSYVDPQVVQQKKVQFSVPLKFEPLLTVNFLQRKPTLQGL